MKHERPRPRTDFDRLAMECCSPHTWSPESSSKHTCWKACTLDWPRLNTENYGKINGVLMGLHTMFILSWHEGHECKIEKRRGRYFSTTHFHLDETQHLSHLPSDLHNIRKICGCATTFTLQVEALHLLPQCLNGRQRPGRWQTHPSDEGLQCQKVGNWRWYVVLMGFYQKISPIHDPVTKFDTPIPVLMNLCYVQHFRGRVFWATRWFFAVARATSHFAMNTSPHQDCLSPKRGYSTSYIIL